MHHALQFLIDLTFNLALVDGCNSFDFGWVENVLKLVLSAELLPKLSFMSLQTSCDVSEPLAEAVVCNAELKPVSSTRRGRDAPFPAASSRRRKSVASVVGSDLLHRRYSMPRPVPLKKVQKS